jgi:uncharacterized protein (UPF0248 family)
MSAKSKSYLGKERRGAISKKLRPTLDHNLDQLRLLYSTLTQSKKQKLPTSTVKAIEHACETLTKKVHKLGLPYHRITEIREATS